jgi:hypothetical protein
MKILSPYCNDSMYERISIYHKVQSKAAGHDRTALNDNHGGDTMDDHQRTHIFDRIGPVRRKHGTDNWSEFHHLLRVPGEHYAPVNKRVPTPASLVHATSQMISAANVIDLINTA